MIHAYNEIYLDDACNLLGSFFDIAVNEQKKTIYQAVCSFILTNECQLFECGYPQLISGASGCDLYNKVFREDIKTNRSFLNKSKEYWLGYYLAYYQWYTSVKFSFIFKYITVGELIRMYNPYHEMDVMHFVHDLSDVINKRKEKTNLEIYRDEYDISRKKLSFLSGVSIRTIEQYEQRRKDINKANATTLISLSKALFVRPEDLLELTDWREWYENNFNYRI